MEIDRIRIQLWCFEILLLSHTKSDRSSHNDPLSIDQEKKEKVAITKSSNPHKVAMSIGAVTERDLGSKSAGSGI